VRNIETLAGKGVTIDRNESWSQRNCKQP